MLFIRTLCINEKKVECISEEKLIVRRFAERHTKRQLIIKTKLQFVDNINNLLIAITKRGITGKLLGPMVTLSLNITIN